jgi:hypothetical protein
MLLSVHQESLFLGCILFFILIHTVVSLLLSSRKVSLGFVRLFPTPPGFGPKPGVSAGIGRPGIYPRQFSTVRSVKPGGGHIPAQSVPIPPNRPG